MLRTPPGALLGRVVLRDGLAAPGVRTEVVGRAVLVRLRVLELVLVRDGVLVGCGVL